MTHSLDLGIVGNGKWIYWEHCDMIRGLVLKDRLLEWNVEQGWEPLCRFLGKDVPDEPFPRRNDAAGFHSQIEDQTKGWILKGFRNVGIPVVAVGGLAVGTWLAIA
jgi:hypothetical protein